MRPHETDEQTAVLGGFRPGVQAVLPERAFLQAEALSLLVVGLTYDHLVFWPARCQARLTAVPEAVTIIMPLFSPSTS